MMEVFFWMSSLSSFHSAAPCAKADGAGGAGSGTIVGLELFSSGTRRAAGGAPGANLGQFLPR